MTHAASLVLGRYRPETLLGRGATSTVRRAVDTRGGPDVAVKSIHADGDMLARVEVEIRAARRLDHPGIVRLLDWGRDDDQVHLVWELVEGPNLKDAIGERGAADGWCAARIAEVMECLAHAHARGVVHRDVKPANVLLDGRGHAHLSDFGVARLLDRGGITMTGDVVGTAAYMAPEQARGAPATPASDVYSAGLLLYELLAGHNPFAAREPLVAMRRAALAERPSLSEARPDLPDRVVSVVEACLSRDPSARPPAARVAQELRDLAAGLAPGARRLGAGRRLVPTLGPAVMWGALAAAAIVAWTPGSAVQAGAAALAVGLVAVRWPAAAGLMCVAGAAALLARMSGGAGMLLAALGLLVIGTGARWPRLLAVPVLAPIAAAAGLLPVAMAGVAALRTWPQRAWAACSGVALTAAWQVWVGGDGVLLGPGPGHPGQSTLAGEGNPFRSLDVLAVELRPSWVPWHAAALVAAALVAPLLLRVRPGSTRVAAVAVWVTALVVVCAARTPEPGHVVAGVIPAAVLMLGWALRPWRTLPRLGRGPASATLPRPAR